jgi:beta-glucosidase-like glycosyl hydrolase
VRNGVAAGNDLLMFPYEGQAGDMKGLLSDLICGSASQGCGGGCLPQSRIDEAAGRILMAKSRAGLLTRPFPLKDAACGYPKNMPDASRVSNEQDGRKKASRRLALLAAEKSQVS